MYVWYHTHALMNGFYVNTIGIPYVCTALWDLKLIKDLRMTTWMVETCSLTVHNINKTVVLTCRSINSIGTLFIHNCWHVLCFLVDCLLAGLGWNGLQICPKHVDVDWRNKLRINSAASWFLLHRYSCFFCFRISKLILGYHYCIFVSFSSGWGGDMIFFVTLNISFFCVLSPYCLLVKSKLLLFSFFQSCDWCTEGSWSRYSVVCV